MMKKVILTFALLLTVSFAFAENEKTITFDFEETLKFDSLKGTLSIQVDACAQGAIDMLEIYEYGPVDDETATDVLNYLYAVCWCETSANPDPACEGL